MPLKTIFLWTMIASLALAAALGITAVLFSGLGRTQERILMTSLLVGLFSVPSLACAVVLDRKRLVPLMWCGIASSLIAASLWLTLVWLNVRFDETIAKSGAFFTVFTAVAMVIGLLMCMRIDRPQFHMVRIATLTCSVTLGCAIIYVVWTEDFDDWTGKLIAVLSILSACGTVVTPILSLIETLKRRGSSESLPSSVMIDLTCPRCQTRQMLPAGPARCSSCKLRFNIEVEEPRCECGYLLYKLEGDRCPECGKPVTSP